MATTPNFNWSTPDNTGLVKNGALDIRTLGNAIDASMVDLKGGTTGQVLAKATNTDMDFTWTTASSGSSNVAGKNGVLNSNFSIWQRGTSIAGSAGSYLYTADRWQTNASTALTVSRQATGDTTNLPFIQYCARVQRNSGSTATAAAVLSQSFESVNSIPYAGRTVTISFYARRGANFSGASNQLEVYLVSGTGTDQNAFVGGFTGATNVIFQTPTLTTTWQRFSYSATVGTTATQIATQFTYTPTGTAGAADFYEVTGVQVEIASSASAYSPNAATFQGELAACQRYYIRYSGNGDSSFDLIGPFGSAGSATQFYTSWNTPTMRTAATALDYANLRIVDNGGSAIVPSNIVIIANSNPTSQFTEATVSGATAFRPYLFQANNNTTAYIGFSAEL
jgi:hypothetical protein